MNHAQLGEKLEINVGLDSANLASSSTTGWYSMADFKKIYARVLTVSIPQTETVTFKLQQAKDGDGTDPIDLKAYGVQTSPTGGKVYSLSLEADGDELDADYTHVRASVVTSGARAGAVVIVRGEPKFAPVANAQV